MRLSSQKKDNPKKAQLKLIGKLALSLVAILYISVSQTVGCDSLGRP